MLAEITRTPLPSTREETTVPDAMVVVAAIGSAMLYALAAVCQQRAASAQPMERSLRLSLLIHLLARPLWVGGLACDIGGVFFAILGPPRRSLCVFQPP